MNRIRFYRPALFAIAIASIGGAPAYAQTDPVVVTPATAAPVAPVYPANPDADLLASEMRFLAQNPRDLRALLSAASISTRLGDTSAALAFYARAEKVDPENPRIMAGRAQVLVRLERPGEALQLFQSAEGRGLPMGEYLADRGLAYDLLGQPILAQRDYKASLAQLGRDDETVRRYALSLAIAGKYDDAMRELDPLLRRSDRAAWRARAFILAMQGDFDGADRIARSMLPTNMGAALAPFFRRLPGLPVSDKAFAVHFGAITPTQARRADAQLAPQMAPYVPERIIQPPPPPPPAAVAGVVPVPAQPTVRTGRRSRRDEPTQLAAVTTAATRPVPPPPAANPLPPPPQYVAPAVQPIPMATPTPSAPVQVASVTPAPAAGLPTMRRVPGVRPSTSRIASAEGDVPIAPGRSQPGRLTPPGPARPGQEDGVLANIVGGIEIPPEELAKLEVPEGDAPAPATTRTAEPAPATSRTAPVAPAARPAKPAATPARTTPAPRKAEPKPPPEPRRFWVQVGIGQNEKLLPQTWRKLVKDNPAVFKGRTAWWTPLRATNRLLTGPFKTAAEAQAFVNTLRKAGVEGVAFTSEPGQKVTKLEVK